MYCCRALDYDADEYSTHTSLEDQYHVHTAPSNNNNNSNGTGKAGTSRPEGDLCHGSCDSRIAFRTFVPALTA
jgi:hypothetical protein